jgi:hypothetical protein
MSSSSVALPKNGHRRVAIFLTLKNVGDTPFSGNPGAGAIVTDDQGNNVSPVSSNGNTGPFGDSAPDLNGEGTLAPGDGFAGSLTFQIPGESNLSTFTFTVPNGDKVLQWVGLGG